ncbi:hypothetical protein [Paenibacillus macquariensis]|uniref:Uncharacterized protein n=1 Tax=Paenibacillus macquariensis TaxID=948756 RepID=A0ABY1K2I4_9BACL|nr:hypothetical protein [Paenibacillus macquariensis]MEC0090183.1 hypothetical protein [Paenibacillus macquariensis]OAB39559.1 hypothetical protein PMSM_00010 [Paenibacillus macquariensis subsp. macquariensis]SIR16862.1 hypothetical protein SAMN05421578_1084 [Paenibacillus macquariensis]
MTTTVTNKKHFEGIRTAGSKTVPQPMPKLVATVSLEVFHFDAFMKSILDYAHSTNSSQHFSLFRNEDDKAYGLDIYPYIDQYLMNSLKETFDIRIFHLIWEHKINMVLKLNYISSHFRPIRPDIIDQFSQIENQALLVRNLALKYIITCQHGLLDKLRGLMEKLARDEENCYHALIQSIG